ncbi:C39 family peptidase [Micromonospora sp. CPCC 206060]
MLGVQYQAQPNYYYCGPAATRIALSTFGRTPSQDELAERLGTTVAGTSSALDITRVLNEQLGEQVYRTTEIRDSVARPEQVDRLVSEVRRAVDDGRAVVANIKGTAVDVDGGMHSFEGGHYLTVTGYRDEGRVVRIADPADPQRGEYWLTAPDLADWIAERGYSA